MRIIYVAHPVGAPTPEGVADNLARARRWLTWVMKNYHVAVIADWLLYCELLDDANPDDRAFGLRCDERLVSVCDDIWLVGGRVSAGMAKERHAAILAGKSVLDLTYLGPEPPDLPVYGIAQYRIPYVQAP